MAVLIYQKQITVIGSILRCPKNRDIGIEYLPQIAQKLQKLGTRAKELKLFTLPPGFTSSSTHSGITNPKWVSIISIICYMWDCRAITKPNSSISFVGKELNVIFASNTLHLLKDVATLITQNESLAHREVAEKARRYKRKGFITPDLINSRVYSSKLLNYILEFYIMQLIKILEVHQFNPKVAYISIDNYIKRNLRLRLDNKRGNPKLIMSNLLINEDISRAFLKSNKFVPYKILPPIS